jgi:hypothetical protein
LFDSTAEYLGQEENIERFCLPLFSKAGSDYAVPHVHAAFLQRPAMSQIYSAYLVNFIDESGTKLFLSRMVKDGSLSDWSKMWVLAALLRSSTARDPLVKAVFRLAEDSQRHEALRAVACIFVGKFGDGARRKALANLYSTVSPYVQAAIYYSSRTWPGPERANAKAIWGNHHQLNSLLTHALKART